LHKDIYDYKFNLFQKCIQENRLIGQKFKTHLGDKLFSGYDIKVLSVSPIEPDGLQNSHWASIVVQEVQTSSFLSAGRHRRTNHTDNEVDPSTIKRINFWDLAYPNESV